MECVKTERDGKSRKVSLKVVWSFSLLDKLGIVRSIVLDGSKSLILI